MIDEKIFWLKQKKTNLPENLEWLAENEKKFLASLRFTERQKSWLLGRWTAKQTLLKYRKQLGFENNFSFAGLEIAKKTTGAPSIYYQNKIIPLSISLSHREDMAVCALARTNYKIGIDIEKIEPRTSNFIEDYFTALEIEKIYKPEKLEQALLANLFWSAKESVLKALEVGLSISTHQIEIKNIETNRVTGWQIFHAIAYHTGESFLGWWQQIEDFVITIAVNCSH